MNEVPRKIEQATRRQFLRRSVGGASLFGLGGAAGLLGFPAQADQAGTTGGSSSGRTLGKEYTYDVSKFFKTDPALIQYDEAAKIATDLEDLRAVAIGPEDRVLAAGDKVVRIFSKTGERTGEVKLAEQPRCVAVAAGGNIFVGMQDHVEVASREGSKAQWPTLGEKANITSIAASGQDVFVADWGNRVVWHYDTDGKLLGQIGKADKEKDIKQV